MYRARSPHLRRSLTVLVMGFGTLAMNSPVPPMLQNPLPRPVVIPSMVIAGDDPARMALTSHNTAAPDTATIFVPSIAQPRRSPGMAGGPLVGREVSSRLSCQGPACLSTLLPSGMPVAPRRAAGAGTVLRA